MALPSLDIEESCICPVENCDKKFKGSSQLTMHLLRHHEGCKLPVKVGQATEFYCPVDSCSRAQGSGQPFPRLGQLKQHYHSVHGAREYSCERCGKSFGLKDVCIRHQAECGTTIQCLTCKETFRSKNALYQHTKRKKHRLPSGSKPRTNKRTKIKPDPSPQQSTITLCPVIVRQVVKLPTPQTKSSEVSTQTDPEPPPVTTATHYTQIDPDITDIQLPIDTAPVASLDASTNTLYDYSIEDTALEQLIDASTNTIPVSWVHPLARDLVDTGTSTIAIGGMVDLATQTNIGEFATLVSDLATQTDLSRVEIESHDFNVVASQGSHDHTQISHDFAKGSHDCTPSECSTNIEGSCDLATMACQGSHDLALGSHDFGTQLSHNLPATDNHYSGAHTAFKAMDPLSHSHTRDTSTSTHTTTTEYGVQTCKELDEISELLSGYGQDFGTQTTSIGEELPQVADLSTQTQVGIDMYTQTLLLSDSSTQTLLDCMSDFSTQT